MNYIETDILILEKVFGFKSKKVYFEEWDTEKQSPMYIPSGKPRRTHEIDAKPVPRFSTDPAACYQLKLELTGTYWWEIHSPFEQGSEWSAGLTPISVTGWNGRPDYRETGKTEMEAVCKVALSLFEETK